MAEYNFPTETIDLPSKGLFYPEGSPLKSGQVDVKYMTAREEDILTSTNLIQKGIVLDKLMDSLIVTKGVSSDDLLVGDLNAVMIAARILAYGKEYPVEFTCGSCGKRHKEVVDLTSLRMKEAAEGAVNGEYSLTLPTGMVITYKILTRRDEKEIQAEVNSMKKINNAIDTESSTRLKYMIMSVNGNRERKVVREFADAMIIRDIRALRTDIKRVSPDVNFEVENISCQHCNEVFTARMPLGANFFWPDLG